MQKEIVDVLEQLLIKPQYMNNLAADFPLPWHQKAWKHLYRAAESSQLTHALLFEANPGSGHVEFIRSFSQALLCTEKFIRGTGLYMGCGACQSCLWFLAHTHPNYHEIDTRTAGGEKSSILLDPIRDLQNKLQQTATPTYQSVALPYHTVIIIYPAELLHPSSSDALLKTLEEPLQGAVFLLASDRMRSLSITLRSRCQSIKLPTPTHEQAVQWIYNQLGDTSIDDQSITLSLQLTHYAPLKSLQAIHRGEINIYQSITEILAQLFLGNKHPAIAAQEWFQHDIHKVLDYLMQMVHGLVALKTNIYYRNASNLSNLSETMRLKLARLDIEALFRYWDILQSKKIEINQHHLNILLLLEYLAYQASEISKNSYSK